MLSKGGVPGVDTTMESPQDILDNTMRYVESVDYTVANFREEDLIAVTKRDKMKFIKYQQEAASESYMDDIAYESYYDDLDPAIEAVFKSKKKAFELDLMNYTTMLDWKALHDSFVKFFGLDNLPHKFELIELVVRKVIAPLKIQAASIIDFIVSEFKKIKEKIGNGNITVVNIKQGFINFVSGNKAGKLNYPINETSMESYSDVLESYLIPVEEGFIENITNAFKPKEFLGINTYEKGKYGRLPLHDKIRAWIEYLQNKKYTVGNKFPTSPFAKQAPNTKSTIINIDDYEVALTSSENDPEFKNPSQVKLYVKGGRSDKFGVRIININQAPASFPL